MPAYRKTSKYSQIDNEIFETKAFGVLASATAPLTIQEVCYGDMALNHVTPQKMARVLNGLCDKGFVKKEKNKQGRLQYSLVGEVE